MMKSSSKDQYILWMKMKFPLVPEKGCCEQEKKLRRARSMKLDSMNPEILRIMTNIRICEFLGWKVIRFGYSVPKPLLVIRQLITRLHQNW